MTLGTAALFRIDANGDTETTATTNNTIIEFNTGATNPDDQSHLGTVTWRFIEDIAIHPNPNRHLSRVADSKLGTIEIELRGFFDTPNTADGIARLFTWMTNDKTNASLPFGRFGLRVDNMTQINLTPSSTIGLILHHVEIQDVEEFQSHAPFVARLYRSGSV